MTHPEHVASVDRPWSGCLASAAIWLALAAMGVAAAYGAYLLRGNAAAAELAPLDDAAMARIAEVYDRHIAPHVHHRW